MRGKGEGKRRAAEFERAAQELARPQPVPRPALHHLRRCTLYLLFLAFSCMTVACSPPHLLPPRAARRDATFDNIVKREPSFPPRGALVSGEAKDLIRRLLVKVSPSNRRSSLSSRGVL